MKLVVDGNRKRSNIALGNIFIKTESDTPITEDKKIPTHSKERILINCPRCNNKFWINLSYLINQVAKVGFIRCKPNKKLIQQKIEELSSCGICQCFLDLKPKDIYSRATWEGQFLCDTCGRIAGQRDTLERKEVLPKEAEESLASKYSQDGYHIKYLSLGSAKLVQIRCSTCAAIEWTAFFNVVHRFKKYSKVMCIKCVKTLNKENAWKIYHHKRLTTTISGEEIKSFQEYRRKVTNLTHAIYKEYKYIINPKNLPLGSEFFTIDHKYSVKNAWKNKLDPITVCHPYNLQMITAKGNSIKRARNSISLSELYTYNEKSPIVLIDEKNSK